MAIKEHQRGLGNWRAQHGGWRLVATLAVTEITSYGVLAYAFGVSLLPMEQELRWSRTAPTGAYVTAKVVFRPATHPVGRWLDHHGASRRPVFPRKRMVSALTPIAAAARRLVGRCAVVVPSMPPRLTLEPTARSSAPGK